MGSEIDVETRPHATIGSRDLPSHRQDGPGRLARLGRNRPAHSVPGRRIDARQLRIQRAAADARRGSRGGASGAALGAERAARIRRIIADPDQACLGAGAPPGTAAAQIAIDRAAGALEASPLGAWLLRQAHARRVVICLDPATELAGYYRAEIRLIGIQTGLAAPAKAVFLATSWLMSCSTPGIPTTAASLFTIFF
jgi:hypothetical protein